MKKLLLHCCCGPCSTAVVERLMCDYDITLFYYNPNIYPVEELKKRAEQVIKVANYFGVKYIIDETTIDFQTIAKGLENEKEGGNRCQICFDIRLSKTAECAKSNNYNIFATTLTVSPYKNAKIINNIGDAISQRQNIEYLPSDFKKNNGFLRSIQLSKQLGLYRQNYCGCVFSKKI